MIVAVDGHPADRADRPLFGQRLRERRVVLKLRDLNILPRLPENDIASEHPRGAERQADSGRRKNLLSIHDPPPCRARVSKPSSSFAMCDILLPCDSWRSRSGGILPSRLVPDCHECTAFGSVAGLHIACLLFD